MNELEKTQPKTIDSLINSESVKKRLNEILGKRASTFATSVVQITSQNTMLQNAEPTSVLGAAITSATLNLPLNNSLGQAYIVPFNEKQKDGSFLVKAQFIIGYKGYKQLAIRSGQYLSLYAKPVLGGQKVDDDSFLGYHFDWSKKESDKIVGYASYYKLVNGFESIFFMDAKEVDKHAKRYSQTYKKGFGVWKDDFEKMALKTVTKLHLNSGEAPLSIEMQNAIEKDQSIITVNDDNTEDISYIDNTDVVEVKELPVLDEKHPKFKVVKESLKNGFTIEQVKTKYQVSEEIEKLLKL